MGKCPAGEKLPSPSQTLPLPGAPGSPEPGPRRLPILSVVAEKMRMDSSSPRRPHSGDPTRARVGPKRQGGRGPVDSGERSFGRSWPPALGRHTGEKRAARGHTACPAEPRPGGGGCYSLSGREAQAPSPRRRAMAKHRSSTHPVAAAMSTRPQRHVKCGVS